MDGGRRLIVVLKPKEIKDNDGMLKRIRDLFRKSNYEVLVEDTEEENLVLFTPFGKFEGKSLWTFLDQFSALGISENIK
ncbi:MAG: hypothetical protein J7L47_05950 [Candidatus Odinarchaeota archaeon]|nr:hypothetical protein [Candidatus Odinarchaeota archaeon]